MKREAVYQRIDEAVRHQSEKRQKWIREVREETLQGTAKGVSCVPCLARSSAASFLGRNKSPGRPIAA